MTIKLREDQMMLVERVLQKLYIGLPRKTTY